MAWNNFEHQVWKVLKQQNLQDNQKFNLAVSGGVDSVALLECFLRLKPDAHFLILHYHHGAVESLDKNSTQEKYRDQCLELLQHQVLKLQSEGFKVDLNFEKSKQNLKTEKQYREARWSFIRKNRLDMAPIVVAHHHDDWLETVLLKMLRGAGAQSLEAFKVWNGEILRPFLNSTKKEIIDYAQKKNLHWFDDPSNESNDHLRNWLRNFWLKGLEDHYQGGIENLANSLRLLIQASSASSTLELCFYNNNPQKGLDRTWYDSLSSDDKIYALTQFLKLKGITDFTGLQLKEILKRLDKNQKSLTFRIARANWVINATQIMLEL